MTVRSVSAPPKSGTRHRLMRPRPVFGLGMFSDTPVEAATMVFAVDTAVISKTARRPRNSEIGG